MQPTSLPTPPTIKSNTTLMHLHEFNKQNRGIADYDKTAAKLGESLYTNLSTSHTSVHHGKPDWMNVIPPRWALLQLPFGRPDKNHLFTQEGCFETTLVPLLLSRFLDPSGLIAICTAHPLICHLTTAMATLSIYNFTWIREYNKNWQEQTCIDPNRQFALTAALLYFNLDVSLMMRYLGNNYTGEYREVPQVASTLCHLKVNKTLIQKYIHMMATGCPNHFNADTSRSNALLYWRQGN
jgi:hypothetical protein